MTLLILAILAALVLYGIALYNRLVARRNRAAAAWSQIDVQLKRRHDLIPNLVAAVKGYMAHERSIFDAITAARTAAMTAGDDVRARGAAEAALGGAVRSLVGLVEAVPELKASATMAGLQEELGTTENRIAMARQHYNDCVLELNTALDTVPSVFVARAFAFQPKPLFEAEAAETRPVEVSFSA